MTDDRILERVRAILRKAERTDNPHEAEAFSAKAAELIDRHRIDVARLRAHDGDGPRYGRTRYELAGTRYLRASLALLGVVATHHGVLVLTPATGNSKYPDLVGAPEDAEVTVMLFRSLVMQRDRAAAASPVPPGTSTTRYRNSFAYGYAYRIANRLASLRSSQRAAARVGGDTTALEVYDRAADVQRWLEARTGERLRDSNRNRANIDPWAAADGDRAARTADLGVSPRVTGGRPAVGSGE